MGLVNTKKCVSCEATTSDMDARACVVCGREFPYTEIDRLRAEVASLSEQYASDGRRIVDLTQQLAAANGRVEMLEDSLRLILPLAKGYVAHNNVGSNRKYIEIAEAALSNLNEDSAG